VLESSCHYSALIGDVFGQRFPSVHSTPRQYTRYWRQSTLCIHGILNGALQNLQDSFLSFAGEWNRSTLCTVCPRRLLAVGNFIQTIHAIETMKHPATDGNDKERSKADPIWERLPKKSTISKLCDTVISNSNISLSIRLSPLR
jgi:hypothetical protein